MRKDKIRKLFKAYVLKYQKVPGSLKKFCKKMELDHKKVKSKFKNINELENAVWLSSWKDCMTKAVQSVEFDTFTDREKFLSLFFSWFEYMEENKLFYKTLMKGRFKKFEFTCIQKEVKKAAEVFCSSGCSSGVFKDRAVNKGLCSIMWILWKRMMEFWFRQKGTPEQLDAMIEKSLQMFFDILVPNLFDSLFDLLKFESSIDRG